MWEGGIAKNLGRLGGRELKRDKGARISSKTPRSWAMVVPEELLNRIVGLNGVSLVKSDGGRRKRACDESHSGCPVHWKSDKKEGKCGNKSAMKIQVDVSMQADYCYVPPESMKTRITLRTRRGSLSRDYRPLGEKSPRSGWSRWLSEG